MPKRDPSRLEMYKALLAMVGIAPSAVPLEQ
jgi:hypothetical protein